MAFVFSVWYFVILAIVAGIVACLLVFFNMDKKDRVMIDKFIKDNQPQEETKVESVQEVATTEVKAE